MGKDSAEVTDGVANLRARWRASSLGVGVPWRRSREREEFRERRRKIQREGETTGKERDGAHLLVRSAGDEADEVAIGVAELVREKRSSGVKDEDGRLVPWKLAVARAGEAERPGGAGRSCG